MLLLLFACAGSSPKDTDTAAVFDWGDIPRPTEVIGEITVTENPSWDTSAVGATIRAAALPTTQTMVANEGDCQVLDGANTKNWLCDPECTWGEQSCIDGTCVDWPAMAPAGDITIEGLKPGTATLEVLDMGYYGSPSGFDGDLFEAGDAITLTSTGGDTPALELSGVGVDTLEDFEHDVIDPGEDMHLSWAKGETNAKIEVRLETGWHGSAALTTIWCVTADDGELTVPASLTSWFEIPSCGECEASTVRRFTRSVEDFGAGPITFTVASENTFVAWWGK